MITAVNLILILIAIYLYGIRRFNYWKIRGIKHDKPIFFFGTNLEGYLLKKNASQIAAEMYWKYPDEKVVGFFRNTKPDLIIRDPEIVKDILVTDFSYFYDRGLMKHKTIIEPILRNTFFANGDLWRVLRQNMTSAFTSAKIKAMFPLIIERGERLQARALIAASEGRPVDVRDLMSRYTIDCIGACGFGLDANSLSDETSSYRKLGTKIFNFTYTTIMKIFLKEINPKLFPYVKITANIESDVISLVRKIMESRNYKPSGRNDFIDLMLECRKKGTMVAESLEKRKADGSPELTMLELTDELIAAQVFIFFSAGFETSSLATSFTLHKLALNPRVQNKVHEEIDRVLELHDKKLSYDAIHQMTYLNWAFKESMRMLPPLGLLTRTSVKPYTFRNINLTIGERLNVLIPLQALHNDPKYFDNPDEFRPERFDPKTNNLEKIKYVYLPFGIGPRACVGERLGEMQSLAGLAAILSRFSVEPASITLRYPKIEPRSTITQGIQGGLPLLLKERKNISIK